MHTSKSLFSPSTKSKSQIILNSTIHITSKASMNSHSIRKKRKVKMWTELEDQQLVSLHETFGNNWIKIADGISERTPSQCIQRWRRKFQPLKTRRNWTNDEDRRLLRLVHEHGNNWKKISSFFNKTGKQIRERYINKLDPTIRRGPFTKEEDDVILQNYEMFGTKWNLISRNLPGRPQNAIKNRFYSHLKKIIAEMGRMKIEDVKTEGEEGKEFEKLNEEESSFKGTFAFEPNENEKNEENVKIEEIQHEVKNEEEEKNGMEEDLAKNWSDDHFLNKYIDFN